MFLQRYGLWDQDGPVNEQSFSPKKSKAERKSREGDEAAKRKKGGREDQGWMEDKVCSTSVLEKLENTGQDKLEMVGVNT